VPVHAIEPAQVGRKSVSNGGHFTLLAGTVFHPYLEYHCTGANQTSYWHSLNTHYRQRKFDGNRSVTKSTLILRPKVFRPYLDYCWIGATLTSYVALPRQALQPLLYFSKSVCNEGDFNLVAEAVFRPYLGYHCIGATQTSCVAPPTHALQLIHAWSKSVSNELHQCGRKSFSPLSLQLHLGNSNIIRGSPCAFSKTSASWSKSVIKGLLALVAKRVFRHYLDYHCVEATNFTRDTPYIGTTSS
jgi:hypothetical protein